MLVDLVVMITHAEEDRVATMIRAAVSRAVAVPIYATSVPNWADALDHEALVRQWGLEHPGSPLGDRRTRRFTMSVSGDGVASRDDENAGAAIVAVRPGTREADRRIELGATVPVVADEFPWSSATRVVTG